MIKRYWAMPNKNTFKIKPIKQYLINLLLNNPDATIVDPFVGEGSLYKDAYKAGFRGNVICNDLNNSIKIDLNNLDLYHLDALDFLKQLKSNYADIVLYDPPYSPRQVSECYHNFGKKVTMETTQSSWRRKHLDEIARITKPEKTCISFGWNSNGVGIKRKFYQKDILLIAHGGSHNDTIMTVEQKEGLQ